jgi:RimJ/RimL family protein N-acetyltransferase
VLLTHRASTVRWPAPRVAAATRNWNEASTRTCRIPHGHTALPTPPAAHPVKISYLAARTLPEETQAFLREARASADVSPRRRYAFGVVHSDAERLIGSIELRVVSREHRRGEIGYVLAHEWWGHGYATEALAGCPPLVLNELGLHKISATCDPENRASVAVLTKNGMHQEGVLRDHIYVRGQWRDRLLFSVIT